MKKYSLGIVLAFFFMLKSSSGQLGNEGESDFKVYVDSILRSSEKRWTEYPKCPPLTDEVLIGLKKEFALDSVRFYFEKLGKVSVNQQIDYRSSMNYFERNNFTFSLLAMAVHSNPDIRTFTVMSMNQRLKLNKGENIENKLTSEEVTTLAFLIYLFENNPIFISGSENATIHRNYLSNIAWNIDLLTNERFTLGQYVETWYKNETNYLSIMKKWKEHLPKK